MTPTPVLEATLSGDRTIVLRRDFEAPPELVFRALTTPDLLVRWYGARGWNLTTCEVDLRVGGRWRFVSQGPGGEVMGQEGVYTAIDPPHHFACTERFDDQSYEGETLVTHDLIADSATGGARTALTSTLVYPSPQARDIVLAYPMRQGVTESYQRLDAVLADLDPLSNEPQKGPTHGLDP